MSHHVHGLAHQGVSNVAWAFAKQELQFEDLLQPLQEAVARTATEMHAQGVANTLWAFATFELDLGAALSH